MASPSPSPKPKRSFRKSLSQKWDKYIHGGESRPSSPSPSQQTIGTPAPQSRAPSPLPPNQTGLAPPTDSELLFTHQVGPVSQLSTLLRVPDVDPRDSPQSVTDLPAIVIAGSPDASTADLGTSIEPVTEATKQATSTIWAGLGTALRVLQDSAELFPPLHSAISAFIPCLGVLEDAARYNREYEDLASEIISSSELLARHMKESGSTRMSEAISKAASSIEEQAQIITNKLSRRIGKRVLEASTDDEELTRCYRQIQSSFRRLQADTSLDADRMVVEREMNIRLGQLDPAEQANYNSSLSTKINRRTCTGNTRKTVLSGLDDWSCDPKAADVYWMSGMAGTGKTTIACSLSKALEDRNQLAASFFCTRTSSECRDVDRIIPTIAYQLARCSVDFRSALCEALVKDPGIKSKAIPVQFDRLLKEPLLKAKEAMPDNLVVVIDALDECESSDGTRLILETLFRFAIDLPLKFFVTSRPEPDIHDKIRAGGRSSRSVLHLHDIEASLVQADIEIFLKEELAFMSPTTTQIEELARRSGNLFIFAATLARYIRPVKGSNPWKRLQSVLEMTSQPEQVHAKIDEL